MGGSSVARFWERWLESNWTVLPNATSNDDYDALIAALELDVSGPTDPGTRTTATYPRPPHEDTVSWTYLTKTIVQLLSAPLAGLVVNRYSVCHASCLCHCRV